MNLVRPLARSTGLTALLAASLLPATALAQNGRGPMLPAVDARPSNAVPPGFPPPTPVFRTAVVQTPVAANAGRANAGRAGSAAAGDQPAVRDAARAPQGKPPAAGPPAVRSRDGGLPVGPAFGSPRQAVPAAATPVRIGVRPGGPRVPRSIRALSLTHIALPEPRAITVHDIITVLVDEKSEIAVQSRFDRRRNATLEASIDEFVRLDPTGRLILSATGDPSIDLGAGVRTQANGSSIDSEAVRYRIAAEVVDVLPNGNVVLEARKQIRDNKAVFEYTLTGTIAAEKVNRDMTALSEDVAALKIEKRTSGKVRNSTRLPWGAQVLDAVWPF